jgi:hypothetical protein
MKYLKYKMFNAAFPKFFHCRFISLRKVTSLLRHISKMLKMSIVALFSIALLVSTSTIMAPKTLAASHMTSSSSPTQCHTLLVHLHGIQPPTKTCLDNLPNSGAKRGKTKVGITPYAGVTSNCQPAFELYLDANFQGATICFIGQGFIGNLESYCLPWTACSSGNWNDNASSYYGGCSTVTIYVDSDGRGQAQVIGGFASGSFNGSKSNPNVLPNDSASSLNIWNNC